MPYTDLPEFSSKPTLPTVQFTLPNRFVRDSDWLYIKVYSGKDLVVTKWIWVRSNKNIHLTEEFIQNSIEDLKNQKKELDNDR